MRLLVAEDDPQLGDSLARGLRETVVRGGPRRRRPGGGRRAALNTYDAMIIDVMLPKRDGLPSHGRYDRKGSTAPILMLTARDAIADRVAGLDAGADDYLVKPFAFDELLARLRALTRRTSTIRETILRRRSALGGHAPPAGHQRRQRSFR